jgi:two-component system chemotaxis response regulator CheB
MASRHIIVIGASAGGVETLTKLVRELPADMPAAVFVTIHFPPTGTSALARILDRAGSLKPAQAAAYLPIEEGHIYVAPPDHHLLVSEIKCDCIAGRVKTTTGPRSIRFFEALLSHTARA